MSSKGKSGVLLGFCFINKKKINSGAGTPGISGGEFRNTGSDYGRNHEYYGDYGWDRNVRFPKMVEDRTQKNLTKEKNKNKKKKKISS